MRVYIWTASILFVIWLSSVIYAPYLVQDLQFSPVLYSKDHELIAAKVSRDGQWRFPLVNVVPNNYKICLKEFEDHRYDFHLGIDPISIIRAIYQNITSKKIVSGGSTISMQLVRLLLKNPPRTFINKIKECWLAIGFEFNFSKNEIINYYASVAPFGGNVVGIQAAMWRYFQRSSNQLSWSEAALLSVLPNQPSHIHLEKNRDLLIKKRNALLTKLLNRKLIDSNLYELSLLEPIPKISYKLPQNASLLLERLIKKSPSQYQFNSTLDAPLQERLTKITSQYTTNFRQNEIHNVAVLLVDNQKLEVVSYIANTTDTSRSIRNAKVNNIHAPRSSGSILKPLLFALSLDRGIVTRDMLMPDIPTLISGFRPENFSRSYSGATPLSKCIQQSLNVPSVLLLKRYGVELFYQKLIELGFTNLFRLPEDYGLSLILGGAEITAWDLANVYSTLANKLLMDNKGSNLGRKRKELNLLIQSNPKEELIIHRNIISNPAIYEMLTIMQSAQLPEDLLTNFYAAGKGKIAWKTGTSFGFKDAWCIGITPEYTMVVWVGNSDGVGRPGLIGIHTAAPLMFELFQSLEYSGSWNAPSGDMYQHTICKKSGFPASTNCPDKTNILHPSRYLEMSNCPYHIKIYTDRNQEFQVFKNCEVDATESSYFNLPPVMEYYYKQNHSEYKSMPKLRKDCFETNVTGSNQLEFIYPNKGTEVFLPLDMDELSNNIVLKAAHKDSSEIVYWFMDQHYLGFTSSPNHEWLVQPDIGWHHFMISDEKGESATATIKCYKR